MGEFLKKKEIDIGFTPLIHYLQGYGSIENVPMLYVFKNITHRVAYSILRDSFQTPAEGGGRYLSGYFERNSSVNR
ncbi:hypothetical protein [Endozoicomonas numazuensis]|uniref:hypothetical protein n=1 Tax=Endozoicomonas numazuensis TaxID=1137799 RepID=UPI000A80C71B|nr:hypothetical protein [Endozoicomonas numazuensis]